MSFLLLLPTLFLVALASFHVRSALQGLPALFRILRLRTTPLNGLTDGPIEVVGRVRAKDGTLQAPSGLTCVVVDVEIGAYSGSGKSRTKVHEGRKRQVRPAELVGDDGTVVALDLQEAEVVGNIIDLNGPASAATAAVREWCTGVTPTADTLELTERSIPDGARVILSGRARVVDAKVEASPTGYRDGAPVERKTFVIEGVAGDRMLIAEGTEGKLLFGAAWPVLLLLATAAVALALAGVMVALLAA